MSSLLTLTATAVLILHGLLHFLGTAVYFRLAEVAEFPYKTTVLGGAWNLGPVGIQVFGALWAAAALGFLVAAVALLLDWPTWRPLLLGVTLFSLTLTTLDWTVAYAGIAVNVGILALLVFFPRL